MNMSEIDMIRQETERLRSELPFIKERDEALLSLDKEKIVKYMKKYGVDFFLYLSGENDLVFWAGVHEAILGLNSATKEQKERSYVWLLENGFEPYLYAGRMVNK